MWRSGLIATVIWFLICAGAAADATLCRIAFLGFLMSRWHLAQLAQPESFGFINLSFQSFSFCLLHLRVESHYVSSSTKTALISKRTIHVSHFNTLEMETNEGKHEAIKQICHVRIISPFRPWTENGKQFSADERRNVARTVNILILEFARFLFLSLVSNSRCRCFDIRGGFVSNSMAIERNRFSKSPIVANFNINETHDTKRRNFYHSNSNSAPWIEDVNKCGRSAAKIKLTKEKNVKKKMYR